MLVLFDNKISEARGLGTEGLGVEERGQWTH